MDTENLVTKQTKSNILPKDSPEEISEKSKEAIDLLNSWIENGDIREQTETWNYLKKSLEVG
ncbi:MAG TPA: hypothetical protein VK892_03670 [Pyrinomonadaceae bacterium]|nr:hypothetical protein [Pyrinomonadaceae bacterium]